MTRWTRALTGATIALLCLGLGVAHAQPVPGATFWNFLLKDSQQPTNATVGSTLAATCAVYQAGTTTLATDMFTDSTLKTAAANPFPATTFGNSVGNSCFWYSPKATTSYDVVVYSKLGKIRVQGLTATQHTFTLGRDVPGKVVKIPWSAAAANTAGAGTSVNTGVTIPAGSIVRDVLIETITASPTNGGHLVVGIFENNPAGLCANQPSGGATGVAIGSTGWLSCSTPKFAGNGGVSSSHAGALLAKTIAATSTHMGAFMPFGFLGDGTNKTISYTVGNDTTTAAGNLYVIYTEVGPVGANTP